MNRIRILHLVRVMMAASTLLGGHAVAQPPVAVFDVTPNPAGCQEYINLDARASWHPNPDQAISRYEWDMSYSGPHSFFHDFFSGDPVARFRYQTFGTYTIALRVVDFNGDTDLTTRTIVVDQGNQAPVAEAGGPYVALDGEDLVLDASGSYDPDEACGDIIQSWAWDLDDDGQFDDAVGEEPIVPWSTLATLGDPEEDVPIALSVVDGFGVTGFDVATLTLPASPVGNEDPAQETPVFRSRLLGASPNPFNPATTITFELEYPQSVRLAVYDMAGRHVVDLADGPFAAGRHPVRWDGRDAAGNGVASGSYLVFMVNGDEVRTSKMVLMR